MTQPAMAHILVDSRIPDRDHIEPRDLDRRFEYDQSLVVLFDQPGRNKCHKVIGRQYLR
jgi:hypothetical protein